MRAPVCAQQERALKPARLWELFLSVFLWLQRNNIESLLPAGLGSFHEPSLVILSLPPLLFIHQHVRPSPQHPPIANRRPRSTSFLTAHSTCLSQYPCKHLLHCCHRFARLASIPIGHNIDLPFHMPIQTAVEVDENDTIDAEEDESGPDVTLHSSSTYLECLSHSKPQARHWRHARPNVCQDEPVLSRDLPTSTDTSPRQSQLISTNADASSSGRKRREAPDATSSTTSSGSRLGRHG